MEAATPLSMAEIQADKDQLRAEFAMSTRRLELSVEQMKAKTTSQLAELGKKTDAINRLKVELGEKTAALFSLEAREKALKDQLQATEAEHSMKLGALREAERLLADKQAEMNKLAVDLDSRAVAADSQRVELVALRAQADELKNRVTKHERDAQETGGRLDAARKAASSATTELNDERSKVEKLSDRVIQLERALVAQTTETEVLNRRIDELEGHLSDQERLASERDLESSQLREKIAAAHKIEIDLRAELETSSARNRSAAASIAKEKSLVEDQLHHTKVERAKLQQEIVNMKREAEQTWAAERVENALLRERINDIAAEIARLTVALEGGESPVESLLANEANGQRAVNGERKPAAGSPEGKGSLADRIRALQLKASRIPATN
jgi:chromosome segregation ATPase